MTTSTGDTGAWQRLGTALKQRRVTLDQRFRNRKAFAEAAGLDYRLIYDIEESRRVNFGVATLTAIEVGYRLMPGSIARLLAGGSLEPARPALAPVPEAAGDDSQASADVIAFAHAYGVDPDDPNDPFLRRVRREIADAIMVHGAGAAGREIFREEAEARVWDDPLASCRSKELLIAAVRAHRARSEADHGNGASSIGLAPPVTLARR